MICQQCGVQLPRSHSQRKTCSGACRTAMSRANAKARALAEAKPPKFDRRKRERPRRWTADLLAPPRESL